MFPRTILIVGAVLAALIVALPVQAQVDLQDLAFQNKTVEPGAGLAMLPGTQTGSAALGDGVIVAKFQLKDIDPIADDASDVSIGCIRVQNLGTALVTDIVQVMVLDQDSNAVLAPAAPAAAGAGTPPAGCSALATTGPNAQVAWEVYFDLSNTPFLIPDDGTEIFQIAVRTATTNTLLDDSQNHTLVLRTNLQVAETVGSPPAPTTFVDHVTDGAPEVIWNGGVNRFTEDTWVVNPIMPGDSGVVSRFTVCDDDADEDQLVLHRFFIRQDEVGTALSSDIASLDLYRVEGFTRTLIASRTPDESFERGSGTVQGLALPGGAATGIVVPDDTCYTFELVAQVSPFATKGHLISPRISVDASEPSGTFINQTAEPEIRTNHSTAIGKGMLILPDTKLIGKPGILPLQVAGVALPGLGTLQVGPNGRLQFDPRVISITDIVGVGPYIVSATEIDNRLGEARFTVSVNPNFDADANGSPDNPLLTALQDGTIAHIVITPTGQPGTRTRLVLTFDCFELVDQNNCIPVGSPNPNVPNQNPNNDITVVGGEVAVLYPGDLDFDGVPTIRDSLLLANDLLVCAAVNISQTTSTSAFTQTLTNVSWSNANNATVSGANLTKSGGTAAWDAGAVSTQSLAFGDGFVETTVNEVNTDRAFGLAKGNTNEDIADIDFGVILRSDGTLRVIENGVEVTPTPTPPNPTVTYSTGDVIRVQVDGPNVLYKQNGVIFHITLGAISAASYPLFVDASLFSTSATLENVQVQSLNFNQIDPAVDFTLTDEQRSVADVAAPFAPLGVIPGCAYLTSADVAEIARLAINFGTSPAPSAVAASVAGEPAVQRPWYSFVSDVWNWLTGTNQGVDVATVKAHFNNATQSVDLGVDEVSGAALGGFQGRVYFDPATAQVHGISGLNGYDVLAYQIDNMVGQVRFVALAPKGQGIHNGNVVRLQLSASETFSPTLSVDALIDEDALDIPFATPARQAAASAPAALSLSRVQALTIGNGAYQFTALGTGILAIQVQVYDLAGGKVFDQEASGNTLSFNALNRAGNPVANGVYLYVITAKGLNGETLRSEVNKLAILR